MEFFEGLKKQIAWFKLDRAIAKEKQAHERERQRLYGYFNSPKGEDAIQTTLSEWGVKNWRKVGIREIGKEMRPVFAVGANQEEFLNAVKRKQPAEIIYERARPGGRISDEITGGDFYLELGNNLVLEAGGLIDDVSGAETLFGQLYNLSYRHKEGEHPTYEQPWSKLHRQKENAS